MTVSANVVPVEQRALLERLFLSEQQSGGPPLSPKEAAAARNWLVRVVTDDAKLTAHAALLGELYRDVLCPFPTAEEAEEPSYRTASAPPGFAQWEFLAESRLVALLEQGPEVLGEAELVQLLLNPFALHDLSEQLVDDPPEWALDGLAEAGDALLERHGLQPSAFARFQRPVAGTTKKRTRKKRLALANDLLAQAELHREHGRFASAEAILVRLETAEVPRSVRLRCCVERARLAREMGNLERSEAAFQVLKSVPDLPLLLRLVCLNNLAWLERTKQNPQFAERYLDEAEKLVRVAGTSPDGQVEETCILELAETIHQRAVLAMLDRRYEDALTLIDKALQLRYCYDGPEKLNIARSLVVRGGILRGLKDRPRSEALRHYHDALKIREDAFRDVKGIHADIADVLCRIADWHVERAKVAVRQNDEVTTKAEYLQAKKLFERAGKVFKQSGSSTAEAVMLSRCHLRLAEACAWLEELKEAKVFAEQALKVLEQFGQRVDHCRDDGLCASADTPFESVIRLVCATVPTPEQEKGDVPRDSISGQEAG